MPRSIAIVLALIAGAAPASAAGDPAPTAQVTVSMERMHYPDGIYRAGFSIDGVCQAPSDAIQVTEAECPEEPEEPRWAKGSVRMVKLGFDAFRRVEAGSTDLPVLETGQAAAPEQLDRVRVDLKRAGALRVEVTGLPDGGLDPRPVAGSVSSGGQISGRSAVWTVSAAAVGVYEFSVRFAPGAPAGFAGTFVPQVTITRTAGESRALDHVGAPQPPASPISIERTSTLLMRQHVAPASGPPAASAAPYIPVAGAHPAAFETSTAMDAAGAYQANVSGEVRVESVGTFDDIAPGAFGAANTAGFWTSRPWIPGADKVDVVPSFDFAPVDGSLKVSGFREILRTHPVAGNFGLVPGGPLAGIFWDGDAAVVGAVGGMGAVSADRQGQPANPGGEVAADWSGEQAVTWSGLWANNLPAGEPNSLNYAKYKREVENAALGAAGYPGGYGPYAAVATTQATVPVVARGGDIDTRTGGGQTGEPFMVRVPQGHTQDGAAIFTVHMPETGYSYSISSSPGGTTITPSVDAGSVWLESTRDGYERDWTNLHIVSVFSSEKNRDMDVDVRATGALAVPEGALGTLDVLDPSGAWHHRELSPGLWRAVLHTEGPPTLQRIRSSGSPSVTLPVREPS